MSIFGISKRQREAELLTALRERDRALGELFALHECVQDEIDALADLGGEEAITDKWKEGESHGFKMAGQVLALAIKERGPFNVPVRRPVAGPKPRRDRFIRLDNNPQA